MGESSHKKLLTEFKLSQNKEKVERLRRIGARVSQVSDRQDYQYHFFLIEKNEINAFTTPGGNIYFFTGLFDRLSDDQAASVLAHEIGHCAARHTIKKFQAAAGYSLIGNIVFSALKMEDQVKQITAMGTGVLMNLVFSSYSRQDEFEADRLGVKYMYLAGYRLEAMVETFEVLKRESKGKEGPSFFRTHPYIDARIEAVNKEIGKVRAGG